MNKKLLISVLCIVLLYAFITVSSNVLNLNRKYYTEDGKAVSDIILDKDMAIKMGRIVLEEYYPSLFKNKEVELDAEEDNGIWKVYNVIQGNTKTKNGDTAITKDIGIYVQLRKRTGEIIKIGVNDET